MTNQAYLDLFDTGPEVRLTDEAGAPLPEDATPWARAASGESFTMRFAQESADGTIRRFEAVCTPISAGGGVVVIRDISDRSQQRIQSEFIAQLSHELRTPLTGLTAYLELLQRRTAKAGDETDARYVDRAVSQAHRFSQLVDELFDASRIDAGRMRYDMELVDLCALVEEAVALAAAGDEAREITLDTGDTRLTVRADPHRLQQVVLNLLSNALHHAPDSPVAVILRRQGANAELSVRDWGPGIAAEELRSIFERQHADPTSPGLGLGLFIARAIVEAHEGTLDVESSPGQGATFRVRLPVYSGEAVNRD